MPECRPWATRAARHGNPPIIQCYDTIERGQHASCPSMPAFAARLVCNGSWLRDNVPTRCEIGVDRCAGADLAGKASESHVRAS